MRSTQLRFAGIIGKCETQQRLIPAFGSLGFHIFFQ
jgi:hypothetical protein